MDRRSFLTTTTLGAATLAFPAVLRAQSKDPIRIGVPLPLTGPFGALAADMQRGAQLAEVELNAKGGILGRKVEVLFRDDQLKPAVGAQRTQELIEKEKCQFIVGGLAAHVQMAINEQTKKSKVLFVSTSQSDEISAKPDTSPITFHEALNPTITCRAVGTWAAQNLGKKWYLIYADYAWGKQCNQVLQETLKKNGRHRARRHPVSARQRRVLRPPAQDPGGQAGSPHDGDARRRQHRLPQAGHQLRHEEGDEDRPAAALDLVRQGGRPRPLLRHLRRDQLLLGASRYDPAGQALRRGVPEEVQHAARRL